jgi:hypothetical protein
MVLFGKAYLGQRTRFMPVADSICCCVATLRLHCIYFITGFLARSPSILAMKVIWESAEQSWSVQADERVVHGMGPAEKTKQWS